MIDIKKAELLAINLAEKSGKILLDNEDNIIVTKIKDRKDVCTNLDLKIEKFLITEIQKVYPTHNILSEEVGNLKKKSDYVWIIDPIDGTKYYEKGVPLFTVSIALQFKKELIVGVVYDPSTGNLYHASKGNGAYLNKKRLKVSDTDKISHVMICIDISKFYELKPGKAEAALSRLNQLVKKSFRIRSLGMGSLSMCYLAQGMFDAYFDITGNTKYVDVAAGAVIVQEAQGIVTDLNGDAIGEKSEFYLASNKLLYDKIRKLLLDI